MNLLYGLRYLERLRTSLVLSKLPANPIIIIYAVAEQRFENDRNIDDGQAVNEQRINEERIRLAERSYVPREDVEKWWNYAPIGACNHHTRRLLNDWTSQRNARAEAREEARKREKDGYERIIRNLMTELERYRRGQRDGGNNENVIRFQNNISCS